MATTRAVRDGYAARASEYTALLGSIGDLAEPDRALIERWSETIEGRAIDAGCGPGHWTGFLHDRGVEVVGIDLVPEFVDIAARRFPDVDFRIGELGSLPVEDASLGGLLSWYSIIHTEPRAVPAVLDEFARCLRPGATLLLGFVDGARLEPFDHAVVTAYGWPIRQMGRALVASGFDVVETHARHDAGSRPHAAILARRRAG
ncbi:class I SAM-dependent methyltransferase [Agromyces sp. NPDC058104]|uniref:class I SAM-dependent methyltransferase n=1 Tax=Agromyces sp. NPDC058104 TaxID=3346342 RepID=UPI0036DA1692